MRDLHDQIVERLNKANQELDVGQICAFSCFDDSEDDLIVNVVFVLPDPPNDNEWDMDMLDQLCAKAQASLAGLAFSDCWFRTRAEFDDDQDSGWVFIDKVAADG